MRIEHECRSIISSPSEMSVRQPELRKSQILNHTTQQRNRLALDFHFFCSRHRRHNIVAQIRKKV